MSADAEARAREVLAEAKQRVMKRANRRKHDKSYSTDDFAIEAMLAFAATDQRDQAGEWEAFREACAKVCDARAAELLSIPGHTARVVVRASELEAAGRRIRSLAVPLRDGR